MALFGTHVTLGQGFVANAATGIPVNEAKPKPKTKAGKKKKVAKAMHDFSHGKMHSGSKTGPVVKNKKQGITIALNQAGLAKKK